MPVGCGTDCLVKTTAVFWLYKECSLGLFCVFLQHYLAKILFAPYALIDTEESVPVVSIAMVTKSKIN